jgi:ABC-type polar amino acid transport system ATPase subunit
VKVIIGPSGSGKSTLLRCLDRLGPPDEGAVYVEEEPLGEIGASTQMS